MAKRYIPENVRRYEWLSYGSTVAYVAVFPFRPEALGPETLSSAQRFAVLAFWYVAFIVPALLLIWLTARKRKNWARWTGFILFLLTLVGFVFQPLNFYLQHVYWS